MKIVAVGDTHGRYARYKTAVKNYQNTIQLGDHGVGFRSKENGKVLTNPPFDFMKKNNHRFIRGNHDNPGVCRLHKQWVKDGHVENGVMFVGGAYSVDQARRTEGYDWWREEELSYDEFYAVMDVYEKEKPTVMLTHDCPLMIVHQMKSHHAYDNSRTQQALQAMFEMHKPKLWVFGHHHKSFDMEYDGTRFVCLAELEVREFEF